MSGYGYYSDDPYYISPEEERALDEREREERERQEEADREEAEAQAWLASRRWYWHAYKALVWRLYWAPRRWFLTDTAIGRRYLDWKIASGRDAVARFRSREEQQQRDTEDGVAF